MASTGNVIVNVFTSAARLPIEGATVLFQQQTSPYRLLALRMTDKSGQTDIVTLDTTDRLESQSPETGITPWTALTLQIDHPDYERLILRGVQVFPGVTTLQGAALIPLQQEDPAVQGQLELTITPQPVWEDTP